MSLQSAFPWSDTHSVARSVNQEHENCAFQIYLFTFNINGSLRYLARRDTEHIDTLPSLSYQNKKSQPTQNSTDP